MTLFLKAWREWLTALQRPQRILLAVSGIVLCGVAVWALSHSLRPAVWQPLYPDLSTRAAGEALAALERLNIPARVHPASGQLEVPADALHLARTRLAALDLPRDDDASLPPPRLGTSSRMEAAHLHTALERSLAVSVAHFDAIESARVHVVAAKVSPFLRATPAASAVVLVRVRKGQQLAAAQTAAIRTLVATAVPSLEANRVEVLDLDAASLAQPVSAAAVSPQKPTVNPPRSRVWAGVGLGVVTLALAGALVGFVRGRRQRAAGAPPLTEDEERARLRTETLANPARAAEVLKLWLR